MVGSPAMNVHSWKQLALWSLEYSCLEDLDKAKGIKIFMEAWEKFCVLVVAKFDHLFVYENDKYVLVDAKAKVEYGIK
jgi:adenosine deaminase CECR1